MKIYMTRFRAILHYSFAILTLGLGFWDWLGTDVPNWVKPMTYILLAAFVLNLLQAGKRSEDA